MNRLCALLVPLAIMAGPVFLPAQEKPYLEHLSDYIENLAVFEENQEPGRAFHIPEKHLSLNGTWKFSYQESPLDVPKDFFSPSFNDRKWGTIEVPSNWEMQGDGTLSLHHKVNPQGSMPAWLPRLGLTMQLDKSLDQVAWHGRGPQASYPDRKSGYRLGIWHTDVDSMYEPYLMPQDYGLRMDTRWVRLTDDSGLGLEFSMDQPFAFNAYDCTTDNLTKAVYQYQLQRGGDITLNLDYATSGVGCTARGIFDAYRVYPAGYERALTIRPVTKK